MLRRLLSPTLHLHSLRLLSNPIPISSFTASDALPFNSLRLFSTSGSDNSDDPEDPWKISPDSDESKSSIFSSVAGEDDPFRSDPAENKHDVFASLKRKMKPDDVDSFQSIDNEKVCLRQNEVQKIEKKAERKEKVLMKTFKDENYDPWRIVEPDNEKEDLFQSIEKVELGLKQTQEENIEKETEKEEELDIEELKRREKELMKTLKGPNRAFGDLISSSGITEGMLDSLILLKDVSNIPGLPPLKEIEEKAIARLNSPSHFSNNKNIEDQSENVHVKQVDEKGRAYATGRRKCSVARVWIQPGEGRFKVNEKEIDVYFPIMDCRAELLRPFTVTGSLGKWDVRCTVKGGGVSGQVGAIRLGISRALQNFEPAYRPYLKAVGYLTRDARVVERKKPGKAKARKSFQWVKR